ncbi:MAG: cytidine/deoxycytidylate deaminase family protein [Desulfovibrio sp.]|nr:cytidine/deoxycytidylate deaminase family protein [Desulfovibrio sp.]
MSRLPWPDYFMHIVDLVRERSTCLRRHVGALAVRDNRILATGYNGVPQGLTHCLDTGCLRQQLGIPSGQRHEICRGLHAEQNVIIQAATNGISIQGADIYTTTYPCVLCCKMLINCKVRTIYYAEAYPDELSQSMFKEAGIPVIPIAIPGHQPSAEANTMNEEAAQPKSAPIT